MRFAMVLRVSERPRALHFSLTLPPDDLLRSEAATRLARLVSCARSWNKELARAGTNVDIAKYLAGAGASNVSAIVYPTHPESSSVSLPARAYAIPQTVAVDRPVDMDGDAAAGSDDELSDVSSRTSTATSEQEDEADAELMDEVMAAIDDAGNETGDDTARSPAAARDSDGEANLDQPASGSGLRARASTPLIEITSSSEDGRDARGATAPPRASGAKLGRARARQDEGTAWESGSEEDDALPRVQELGRMAGEYKCLPEDIERMASRTQWLSGQGLAVFAESHHSAAGRSDIGHLPSTFFIDLKKCIAEQSDDDIDRRQKDEETVSAKLKKVRGQCCRGIPLTNCSYRGHRRPASGSSSRTSRRLSIGRCSKCAGASANCAFTIVSPPKGPTHWKSRSWLTASSRSAKPFLTATWELHPGHGLVKRCAASRDCAVRC